MIANSSRKEWTVFAPRVERKRQAHGGSNLDTPPDSLLHSAVFFLDRSFVWAHVEIHRHDPRRAHNRTPPPFCILNDKECLKVRFQSPITVSKRKRKEREGEGTGIPSSSSSSLSQRQDGYLLAATTARYGEVDPYPFVLLTWRRRIVRTWNLQDGVQKLSIELQSMDAAHDSIVSDANNDKNADEAGRNGSLYRDE